MMFARCPNFNVPLNITPETPITSMMWMFDGCHNFDQEVIVPSSCENFYGMLQGSGDIGTRFTSDVHIYAPRSEVTQAIGEYRSAFSGSGRFNGNVVFHRQVVSLGYCFSSCRNLNRTQYIPRGTRDVSSMYYGCTNFNAPMTFPDTIENAVYIFSGCWGLRRSINLPDNINAYQAYSYCFNLNSPIRLPRNSNLAYVFYECTNYNQPTHVPQFVNDVSWYGGGESMFYWCENLNSPITFDDSIQCLTNTFRRCTHFNASVTLPSNLREMSNTFEECMSFNYSIHIPSSVINMYGTFRYCANFNTSISLPSSLRSLWGTFAQCYNFDKAISLPSGIKEAYSAFSNCYNFTHNVALPHGIEDVSVMFSNCYNLNIEADIPSSVTYCGGAYAYTKVANVNIHSAQIGSAGAIRNTITAWCSINTSGKTPSSFNYAKYLNGDYWNYDNYRRLSWGSPVGIVRLNKDCIVTGMANRNLYDAYRNNYNYAPHNIVGGNGRYLNYTQYRNQIDNTTNAELKARYNHGRLFQLDYEHINVESNVNYYDYRILYFDYPNARSDADCPVYWYKVEWI